MTGPVLPATCRTYDPAAGGVVVLDDGRSIPYAPGALAGTPLRLLRPGQRLIVRLDRPADESGSRVVSLTLPSLPLPSTPDRASARPPQGKVAGPRDDCRGTTGTSRDD